jgi:biofilm PGA synthesis protein PgaD
MVEVPQHLHFDAAEELTPRQRTRDTMITALLWAVYLYLWVPLISLLAWALGFEFAYDVMVRAGGARDLLPILLEYAVVISLIFSGFTIWSISNRLRFKHMNRRSLRRPVADINLAEYFRIPVEQLYSMRAHRIMYVDLDETGRATMQPVSVVDETIDEASSRSDHQRAG